MTPRRARPKAFVLADARTLVSAKDAFLILDVIRGVLWLDPDTCQVDEEKSWSPDTLQSIADILVMHKLEPRPAPGKKGDDVPTWLPCSVCGTSLVCSAQGYDTCQDCARRV
jgi:hypothetical protein